MSAYYNEFDKHAAAWLRELIKQNLIAPGDVDERSITDVRPDDLRGYTQVHFFAGIGGWSHALRLAGWPDDKPVWTGSCPCQPYSAAGKRKGDADDRNLWPEILRLIAACRPQVVFGEQVASSEIIGAQLEASFLIAVQSGDFAKANKLANKLVKSDSLHYHKRWLDGIHANLAEQDYAVWTAVLGAHSVRAPHLRQRLYWMAYAGESERRGRAHFIQGWRSEFSLHPANRGTADGWMRTVSRITALCGVGNAESERRNDGGNDDDAAVGNAGPAGTPSPRCLECRRQCGGDAKSFWCDRCQRLWPRNAYWLGQSNINGRQAWNEARLRLPCPDGEVTGTVRDTDQPGLEGRLERNGSARELPSRTPGAWSDYRVVPCADGKARRIESSIEPLAHGVPARMVRLRGYGNAIVPQVAASFIQAFKDSQTSPPGVNFRA